jgi:DNA-binding NarL/FixJ family response regulator
MTPDQWVEARSLWADGFSTKEIADELGIDEAHLWNNMVKLLPDSKERAA